MQATSAAHEQFQTLYFTVDKGRHTTPPTSKQARRENKALGVYWLSRQGGGNVWRCYLWLQSAN